MLLCTNGFYRESCVCDSFYISYFHVCWWVVTRGCVLSAVLHNLCQKTTMSDFHWKSLKSPKIDNIYLTQHFSLTIFTDFRYRSIKITWLHRFLSIPILIDWLLRAKDLRSLRSVIDIIMLHDGCCFLFLDGALLSYIFLTRHKLEVATS